MAESRITNQYLAGLFDGEGCVHTSLHNGVVGAWLAIAQKNEFFLRDVAEYLGYGRVVDKKHNGVYEFIVARKEDALDFIERILPHSILRRNELILIREVFQLKVPPGKVPVDKTGLRMPLMMEFAEAVRWIRRFRGMEVLSKYG